MIIGYAPTDALCLRRLCCSLRATPCAVLLLCAAMEIPSPAQTFTTLVSFNGTNGASPTNVSLAQGADGNYYGTTNSGGSNNSGTVFKVTPGGVLTTLHTFAADGSEGFGGGFSQVPMGALVQAADGSFFGTTPFGGTSGSLGTIFRFVPAAVPLAPPSIGSGGVVPVGSSSGIIQPGEWVSIYGTNLAGGTATWTGNGDSSLQATVGGVQTPSGVVISLQ